MSGNGDDLRRKILDASILLVAEQGVRAVSFREVARRAGVSHQTPYHHFGHHLGILHAIAREGFTLLNEAMTEAAASERHAVQALHAAGVAYVTFACAHVGHFRVMFQGTLMDAGSAELPEAAATYGTLVRLTKAARSAGSGKPLSAAVLSQLAWSTVHGLSILMIEGILAKDGAQDRKSQESLVVEVVGALTQLLQRRPEHAALRKVRKRASKLPI